VLQLAFPSYTVVKETEVISLNEAMNALGVDPAIKQLISDDSLRPRLPALTFKSQVATLKRVFRGADCLSVEACQKIDLDKFCVKDEHLTESQLFGRALKYLNEQNLLPLDRVKGISFSPLPQ
jgi:hypothetical protein